MVTHSISEAIYLSDRVLALSPRPGCLNLQIDVNLPRPRTPEMRYTPEFGALAHQLRDSLRQDEA
jgi:NitT/TauT family transport system ATP-binding protein